MVNVRSKIYEKISKAKVDYPDAFYDLQDIKKILDNVVIVPKSKFNMKYFNFEKIQSDLTGETAVKGTISFNTIACIDTATLSDDKHYENYLKEYIRDNLLYDIEYSNEIDLANYPDEPIRDGLVLNVDDMIKKMR